MSGNKERGMMNDERRTQFSSFIVHPLSFIISTVLLSLLFSTTVVSAQAPAGPRLVGVQVGFNDCYKLGCWTPVTLTFAGGSEPATGLVLFTTADGDDVPVKYTGGPVLLAPGRNTPVVVYAKFGRRDVTAEVDFFVGTQRLFHVELEVEYNNERLGLPAPLSNDDRLVVCVGRMPSLEEVASTLDLGNANLVTTTIVDPALLPTRSFAYEGVDAVVIAPDRVEPFAVITTDGAQIAALTEWVTLGGRCWIALSDTTSSLFTTGGVLERFAAVGAGAGTPLPRTSELEKFASDDEKLPIAAAEFRRKPLTVPRASTDDVVVDAAEGDLPLVLRRAFGLGTVVVTTFHPEHPLLVSWPGRAAVVRKLLHRLGVLSERELLVAEGEGTMPENRQNYGNYGYNDLAGQLRSSLDDYAGVQVVSFFALAMMVLGYLTLVGPVDYWFVRRVLKRPEMTWITFPTIVVMTSLAAYFLAVRLKGNDLRVNRADVVDCDAATGVMRTSSWAGVFSPVGQTYNVSFEPTSQLAATTDIRAVTSWFGLPGVGLGGMDGGGGGGGWLTKQYVEMPGDSQLVGVPIQVWSSKMFTGSRSAKSAAKLHEPLSTVGENQLHGTVRNPFTVDVQNAVICYGPRAYEVGELKAGESRDVASLPVRDLQLVLQDWRVVLSANKNPVHVGKPHDPGSREVDEILRKMMFFTAAGAEDHANLHNRFLSTLDLSSLVMLRRAVLVGRIDPAAVGDLTLSTAGGSQAGRAKETRTAFVRLVIPVNSDDSGR